MHQPLCIGHRGAKGYLPENTLPSFELAIDQGANWIELDVYTVMDELVVIHDDEVDRTTNGTGAVAQMSLDELRSLDAGDGAQIPLLTEVLDLVDHRCGVNIELKGPGTAAPVNKLLDNLCADDWDEQAFLLSSFDHKELAQTDPRFLRGALFGRLPPDWSEQAQRLDAWSVNFHEKTLTEELVESAHQQGFKVLVYTVNEPSRLREVLALGVDGIFSDYPDRLRLAIDTQ